MSVVLILIIVAVGVALGFLGLFAWAVRSGQYDDTDGPPRRMLFDDTVPPPQRDINKRATP